MPRYRHFVAGKINTSSKYLLHFHLLFLRAEAACGTKVEEIIKNIINSQKLNREKTEVTAHSRKYKVTQPRTRKISSFDTVYTTSTLILVKRKPIKWRIYWSPSLLSPMRRALVRLFNNFICDSIVLIADHDQFNTSSFSTWVKSSCCGGSRSWPSFSWILLHRKPKGKSIDKTHILRLCVSFAFTSFDIA